MNLPILFEHPDFIIVDKPARLNFHREEGEAGLAHLLGEQYGKLWPVHRLDKMTSGLVIFARSPASAAAFLPLFESHQIEKYYQAVASGKPKKKQGLVLGDMDKSRNGCWRLLRSRENPAKTRFISESLAPGIRAYLLRPYSGKTHQLRVMMKSLGTPILGDERYGGEHADRGYLDAFALRFYWQGERIEFSRACQSGELFCQYHQQLETWQYPWRLERFPK